MWDSLMIVGKALFFLLINPLTFMGIYLAVTLGANRVHHERTHFSTKFQSSLLEIRTLFQGVIFGLLLSIATALLGIVVPTGFLFLIILVFQVCYLLFQYQGLSSAYSLGISLLAGMLMVKFWTEDHFFFHNIQGDITLFAIFLAVLMGVLLLIEGHLIYWKAHTYTSPMLVTSKRGKTIGGQIAKRVWLVPVLIFVPIGTVSEPVNWSLLFTWEASKWLPIFFPFLIGFSHEMIGRPSKAACEYIGSKIFYLAIAVIGLGLAGFISNFFLYAVAMVAIIGRLAITILANQKEREAAPYYTEQAQGAVVIGVISGTPAAKMKIAVGEKILTLNDQPIHQHADIYNILQRQNSCLIEVEGVDGKVRVIPYLLKPEDHHELGLVVTTYSGRTRHTFEDSSY